MLICPQCQFENPANNKFCQSCGFSLTDTICCECGARIPLDAATCHRCGASNQTVLWAIISQQERTEELVPAYAASSSETTTQELEIQDLADFFSEDKESESSSSSMETGYLHAQKRYVTEQTATKQPIKIEVNQPFGTFFQGRVIDKYPLQKSFIATLQKQQMDLFAELGQDLDDSYLAVSQYWNLIGVPTHALPYLILEKYAPIVPEIYDAWQQEERGVVLLPDRSQWQLLCDLWSSGELVLLQIVWFLNEMAKLWTPLSQVSCAQSLLITENLRLDEDQAFCLQQLYLDDPQQPPTLQDLAATWQTCFTESGLDCPPNLAQLLTKVTSGELTDVEQLRTKLQELDLEETKGDCEASRRHRFTVDRPRIKMSREESQFQLTDLTPAENTIEPDLDFFDEVEEDLFYSSDAEDQATATLGMQLNSITDASSTDIGAQRDHNEDFFGVQTSQVKTANNTEKNLSFRGLYIVCDGMGGHAAGEVASAMAVETLQNYFQTNWQGELPDPETIAQGVLLANDILYQTNINNSRSGSGRMGTTLVMAMLYNNQLAIAHVGDSRIYRLTRKQGLEQLTTDHEVGQREVNRGVEPEIAYGRPDAYQLTQALGPRDSKYVRPEIQFLEITEDCLLLLCTDGLSDNNLLEQYGQDYLEPLISSSSNLEEGLFKLIEFANQHNGHDNITGILVRIKLKPDF